MLERQGEREKKREARYRRVLKCTILITNFSGQGDGFAIDEIDTCDVWKKA